MKIGMVISLILMFTFVNNEPLWYLSLGLWLLCFYLEVRKW